MKSFTVDGQLFEVPEITVVPESIMPGTTPIMQITEGPFAGVRFIISNIQMDENVEDVMHYDLKISDGAPSDEIKQIVDNFIIQVLHDQIDRKASD